MTKEARQWRAKLVVETRQATDNAPEVNAVQLEQVSSKDKQAGIVTVARVPTPIGEPPPADTGFQTPNVTGGMASHLSYADKVKFHMDLAIEAEIAMAAEQEFNKSYHV